MTTSLAVRTRPRPAQLTAIGTVPLVTVRPAPQWEPPYDDERALAFDGQTPEPETQRTAQEQRAAEAPPVLESQRAAQTRARQRGGPPDATALTGGGAPPRISNGGRAAHRYIGLCLEVLEGFRPVGHLRRFTVPAAFEAVAGQLARPVARAGHQPAGQAAGTGLARQLPAGPGVGDGLRGRAASPGGGGAAGHSAGRGHPTTGTGRDDRIRVRHLRVAEPREGAVEAVAVLGRAGRAWALALRLERHDDTWLCAHAEVV